MFQEFNLLYQLNKHMTLVCVVFSSDINTDFIRIKWKNMKQLEKSSRVNEKQIKKKM